MTPIQGWMSPRELIWLANNAIASPIIVEFGSWKGLSSWTIAKHCSGTLFCVDHFRGAPGSASYGEAEGEGGPQRVRQQFLDNMREWIQQGRCFLLETSTRDAAKHLAVLLKHRGADMVFVDADHSYDAVKHDIEVGLELLRPGGLICGHDLQMESVRSAVKDVLKTFASDDRIWHRRTPCES